MNRLPSLFAVIAILFNLSFSASALAQKAPELQSEPTTVHEVQRVASPLYQRLGGEAAIKAVVNDFVARASTDDAVNFKRSGRKRTWDASEANIATLKEHLVQFLCMATGGPQTYRGKSMEEAHKDLEITAAEFDALSADLKASLKQLNVPAQEQQELMAIAETTRGAIVTKKDKTA